MNYPNLHDHVVLPIGGCKVEEGVSTHVHHIVLGSPHEEHVDNVSMAIHAGIVEGCEPMFITVCVCVWRGWGGGG